MSQAGSLPPSIKQGGIRWGWIVAGALILTASIGFSLYQADDHTQYYMTISEYRKRQEKYDGKKLKLAGKVALGSLKVDGQNYRFIVEDLGESITVSYSGLAPDTFKEGVEVVVEGRGAPGDEFIAQTLMAKCASKYEAGGLPPIESMRSKSVY